MASSTRENREPPDQSLITDIYIDESSQTKNRYLVLGGIGIPKLSVPDAEKVLAQVRLPQLPNSEMKWGKISKSKINAYGRTVKAFFDSPVFKPLHFHSIVIDTHALDHGKHNQGSREIGFNKELYHLATKFARLYGDRLFHLYPDYRDTNQRPEDLRVILNRGRRKNGDQRDWPFRRCQFRNSKETPLLQLVDLLTGAVAWSVNGHASSPDASEAKTRIAAYVMKRAGITEPIRGTTVSGKFTIWVRQLK